MSILQNLFLFFITCNKKKKLNAANRIERENC